MKKQFLTFVMTMLMLTQQTTVASSSVLTFDEFDLESVDAQQIQNGYGGFDWSMFYMLSGDKYKNTGYFNGVVSENNVAYNAGGYPASMTRLADFDFVGAYFTGAWKDNLNINIKGLNNGNTVYDSTITVSAYNSIFYTFNYLGIDELRFNSFGGIQVSNFEGTGTHFVMDNFSFYNTTVPEPSTVLLLGAGLLGLTIIGRKKRI